MIGKISETVLNTIKAYYPQFTNISINNNILILNNKIIELKNFNLDTILENYNLKLELPTMVSDKLFQIINLNSTLFNANYQEENKDGNNLK